MEGMILPTKHLSPDRAIITIASEVFELINNRSTVSSVWNEFQEKQRGCMRQGEIPYDWFVLSLDFLYLIGSIEEDSGRLSRVTK
ncbi:ABC-three component system middle component 6 [Microbulbifer sp. CnH-101-G]|uniref:ABC-three component system middle component 6 n=1 Tax=Microbulbifer sp. CnH-101-G TaxID=3243393 RepID=UPI0040392B14